MTDYYLLCLKQNNKAISSFVRLHKHSFGQQLEPDGSLSSQLVMGYKTQKLCPEIQKSSLDDKV